MFLALAILAQVAAATPTPTPPPTPAPVRTKDPRPIPVRRTEEFPGNYVLHYREWKQHGSIILTVNYRPQTGWPGGSLSVFGSVDLDKGWRWLKDHALECLADGVRLDFEGKYDGDVEDGYLAETVRAPLSRDDLLSIAKGEKVECSVGGTQMDTDPKRRADLLKDLGE